MHFRETISLKFVVYLPLFVVRILHGKCRVMEGVCFGEKCFSSSFSQMFPWVFVLFCFVFWGSPEICILIYLLFCVCVCVLVGLWGGGSGFASCHLGDKSRDSTVNVRIREFPSEL